MTILKTNNNYTIPTLTRKRCPIIGLTRIFCCNSKILLEICLNLDVRRSIRILPIHMATRFLSNLIQVCIKGVMI